MRIAIVFFPDKKRDKLLSLCKGLGSGLEAQGHQVDIIDGSRDVNSKLTVYRYIVVGTEAISMFGGRIPDKIAPFISGAGIVSGKRAFAFVLKSFLGSSKALTRLMKALEKEGMFIKFQEILQSEIEAEEIGKRLLIK